MISGFAKVAVAQAAGDISAGPGSSNIRINTAGPSTMPMRWRRP